MTSDPLTMLAELDRYYRKNKISAAAFACKNEKKCNAGCAPHEFVPTREAFVGPEYEKGTLPRILFISLDPADDWPGREPERRTLQAMRDSEPTPCNPGPKGRHWYETHIWHIVSSNRSRRRLDKPRVSMRSASTLRIRTVQNVRILRWGHDRESRSSFKTAVSSLRVRSRFFALR
jgi:hypothetical protein